VIIVQECWKESGREFPRFSLSFSKPFQNLLTLVPGLVVFHVSFQSQAHHVCDCCKVGF
jgi:hypothetical protein